MGSRQKKIENTFRNKSETKFKNKTIRYNRKNMFENKFRKKQAIVTKNMLKQVSEKQLLL